MSLPDGLREALGQVIADQRREWRREREVIEAQARQTIAELRAEIVELKAQINEKVDAKLATVKDGEPGRSVDEADVEVMVAVALRQAVAALPPPKEADPVDMTAVEAMVQARVDAAVAKIPPAEKGADADPVVMERMIGEAVAKLPPAEPGKPGASVTVADVTPLLESLVEKAVGALPPAKNGESVTVEQLAPLIDRFAAEHVAAQVAALPPAEPGAPGRSVTVDDVAPMIVAEVARVVAALPPPKAGDPGKSVTLEEVEPLLTEIVGRAVAALPPAKEGPPGKLPIADEWVDRVYAEADVVTFEGAVYQALRLTGKAPGHDDWRCIARGGRDGVDGKTFNIRGTWAAGQDYRGLDVVTLDGGAFVARRDDPGPCPGDGWQLIAMRGKPGRPGDKGDPGKGIKGDPGPAVVGIEINHSGMVTLKNADGSTASGDFYDVLSKLAR